MFAGSEKVTTSGNFFSLWGGEAYPRTTEGVRVHQIHHGRFFFFIISPVANRRAIIFGAILQINS